MDQVIQEQPQPAQEQEEELTEDQIIERLVEATKGSTMSPSDKGSVFAFLNAVATAKDTTKTGYLRDDKDLNEIGIPKVPVRTSHSMALIAEKIMDNVYFKEYFESEAEIVTKTSLSRDGKLISLAVLQKKEIADVTKKPRKANKSWFKPKAQAIPYGEAQ